VLFYNGNIYRPVPLAYSFHMKKSHESMHTLLNCMDYDECKWKICRDFEGIGTVTWYVTKFALNTAVSYINGTITMRNITMHIKTGLSDALSLQENEHFF